MFISMKLFLRGGGGILQPGLIFSSISRVFLSKNLTFIDAQGSLDNLIVQNVITWGCRLAYQNQNSAYMPAVLSDT